MKSSTVGRRRNRREVEFIQGLLHPAKWEIQEVTSSCNMKEEDCLVKPVDLTNLVICNCK